MSTKPDAAPEQAAEAVESPEPRGLWPRLLEAQSGVDVVGKGGRNDHHGYDYAKAEDVIREAARALQNAGLVAFVRLPADGSGVTFEDGRTSGGNASKSCTVRGELVVKDPETLEEIAFDLYGTGVDTPGDKAFYKAMTGGKKYAYASALQIGFGDDPEDGSTPGGKANYLAPAALPPFAQLADEAARPKALAAIAELIGAGDDDAGIAATEQLLEQLAGESDGQLRRLTVRTLLRVGVAKRELAGDVRGEEPDEPADAPAEPEVDEPAEKASSVSGDGEAGDPFAYSPDDEKPAPDPEALAKAPAHIREALEAQGGQAVDAAESAEEAEIAKADRGEQAEIPAADPDAEL